MGANNKIIITTVCSLAVVAMVVAAVVVVTSKHPQSTDAPSSGASTSMKAVKDICQPTTYKESCEKSLSEAGNTTDSKALIKASFKAGVKEIETVLKKSAVLQQAAKDPSTSQAYKLCQELLEDSIDDLHRTIDEFSAFDISKLDDYLFDLKTWLAGTATFQETCLDGFENTTGDAGENMKKLLKTSREITINGVTLVNEFSKLLGNFPAFNRRLLNLPEIPSKGGFPSYVNEGRRRLLQATPATITPDVVVAKDGSGKYTTINEALKDVPLKATKPFVIYIKEGVYEEYVLITKEMLHVVFIGDGPTKTKITGNKSYAQGVKTFSTATVAVDGFYFMAKDMGFENSAGARGHQAVALRVTSDQSVLYNCQIDGYQDTLYAHAHRQFYRDCTISGTIDFIFGDATAVFQNCKLIIRMPGETQSCMVTAQGRTEEHFPTGFVLQNCVISGEPDLIAFSPRIKSYLGRPWKNYSRTIFLNSQIDSVIEPEGWSPWAGDYAIDTCWYAEYGNRGAGAEIFKRVTWPGIKTITTPEEAEQFTPDKFLLGDTFIPASGVPYAPGMITTS